MESCIQSNAGKNVLARDGVSPTVTLVTEAYNLAEGQSEASFLRAVEEVDRIASRTANVDIVVIDPTPGNIAAPILSKHFPNIKALHLAGQSYDGQKNTVSRMVKSEFVVFLDGDCKPKHDDWLTQILSPFADAKVPAVSGLTFYEDFSITGKAMTLLDFGFLFNPAGRPLGCYVSNNIAFRREAILRIPIPDIGLMRCHCYKHAQLMLRARSPIRFHPQALVLHELPDVQKERHRRGFDYVAALWADPELVETSWLEPTETFVSRVLKRNIELGIARLRIAPPELEITAESAGKIESEMRRLIALDAAGIWEALKSGEASGLNQKARATHFSKVGGRAALGRRKFPWF